jgi:hypothetical protein
MKYGAVIIENRFPVDQIVSDHKKFLPEGWEVIHLYDPSIKNIQDYNSLLTSLEFWHFLPFDKVLIFQHDSALLRNGIEDFLGWDYVGAPWKFQHHGGNGGLSWRSKSAMIECIMHLPWNPRLQNEDVYFSNLLKNMPQFKLAPREVCEKFSCESIYAEGTLGYHAIDKYLTKEECIKIKTQYDN